MASRPPSPPPPAVRQCCRELIDPNQPFVTGAARCPPHAVCLSHSELTQTSWFKRLLLNRSPSSSPRHPSPQPGAALDAGSAQVALVDVTDAQVQVAPEAGSR